MNEFNGLDHYYACKALTALLMDTAARPYHEYTNLLKIARTRAKLNKAFGLKVNHSI